MQEEGEEQSCGPELSQEEDRPEWRAHQEDRQDIRTAPSSAAQCEVLRIPVCWSRIDDRHQSLARVDVYYGAIQILSSHRNYECNFFDCPERDRSVRWFLSLVWTHVGMSEHIQGLHFLALPPLTTKIWTDFSCWAPRKSTLNSINHFLRWRLTFFFFRAGQKI